MNDAQILDEIKELNLAYLILAQNLIRADRAEALYRLGLTEETADGLASLSAAQLMKIANANLVMCRFRFDDDIVWNLLQSHGKDRAAAGMHASILMAGKMSGQALAA